MLKIKKINSVISDLHVSFLHSGFKQLIIFISGDKITEYSQNAHVSSPSISAAKISRVCNNLVMR